MKRIIAITFFSILSAVSSLWGQTYRIGDLITNVDGSKGIVFYVNNDRTDGWMVALHDLPSQSWGLTSDIPNLQNLDGPMSLLNETDGYTNTGIIRQYHASLGYSQPYGAGSVDYEHEWYIPTAGQLQKLCSTLSSINGKIIQAGGASMQQHPYFSSTEAYDGQVWTVDFGKTYQDWGGEFSTATKSQSGSVCFRAVRNIKQQPLSPIVGFPDNVFEAECNQPLVGNPWDIQLLYSSPENDVASYSPIVVGDIDGNGVTDIVVAKYNGNNYRSREINVYSGLDLSLQHSFTVPDTIYLSNGPYVIGRYPKSNGTLQGAIFTHCYDKKIRAYSINGTLLNVSDRPTSCDGMVSLADFNGDGYPEVYSGSDIFDAATLKWLCSGPNNGNKGLSYRGTPSYSNGTYHHTYYTMSLACNVIGDEKQELICGNTIYNVNIVSRTNPNLNSITVNKTITPPSGFSSDGHVSLADFDLDGECEVLVIRDNTNDQIVDNTYFYAYKPSNGQIVFQNAHQCASTSYVFIGNIDIDPHPEIIFLENQPNNYYEEIICWRYTPQDGLSTIWTQGHDDRSGQTAMTLFDFNQDNIMELVYRDNNHLRVINASGKSHITGNDTIRPYNIYTRMMAAGTGIEYPVVADVNSDGTAEILVTGLLDDYAYYDIGYGGLHVFGNPQNWGPARKVWNQYMYHVTNVNEDLTIPTICFNTATVFTGTDGTMRRPYNNFLQQAGYITPQGEPYNPSGYVEAEHYGEGCETYVYHGVTYTESGDYEYLIETPTGCDTLLTVHVHLGDTIHTSQYKSVCEPYTWNGIVYDETGIYQQTFTSVQGCDSIVTLYLNMGNQIMTNFAVSTCDSYTWNGTTYTESGLYEQTFTSQQDCDSIVLLNLTIKQTPYVSQIHGETLIYCMESGDFVYSIDPVEGCFGYEWHIDNDWPLTASNDSPECSLSINHTAKGTLTVRVYTECGYVERSLTIKHDTWPWVVVWPNPNNGEFNLGLHGMKGKAVIEVYNYLGQRIDSFSVDTNMGGTTIPYSLKGKAAGVYILAITHNYQLITKKVVKTSPALYGVPLW